MGDKFARVSFSVRVPEDATEADVSRLLYAGTLPSDDVFSVDVEEMWEED